MLFNSYLFLFLFLPVCLLIYFGLNRFGHFKAGIAWLTVASLVFYAAWNPVYAGLLVGSVAANYGFGRAIATARRFKPKQWLVIGITFNLLLLGYFKYTNFLLDTVGFFTGLSLPQFGAIILPLGISFFTFTQIAYLVDCYRTGSWERRPWFYALFVTVFPHLLAGPILHHREMLPQFDDAHRKPVDWENLYRGLGLFVLGLAKKVLIADTLAPWSIYAFNGSTPAFYEAWFGVLSYSLQLYFDFSGYSDMAVGLAWMLNLKFPINFNSPYQAASLIDFWRRWHITLSQFLRDYLYIPLGGNRSGPLARYRNLLLTMLLGGLWHGAAWTFVVWGGLHGLGLVVNHLWRSAGFAMPVLLGRGLTFLFVALAWVFFRAESFEQALAVLTGMGNVAGALTINPFLPHTLPMGRSLAMTVLLACAFAWLAPNSMYWAGRLRPTVPWIMVIGGLLFAVVVSLGAESPFIYYQF